MGEPLTAGVPLIVDGKELTVNVLQRWLRVFAATVLGPTLMAAAVVWLKANK